VSGGNEHPVNGDACLVVAIFFARSIKSRLIMQVSTTARATRVPPSSKTIDFTYNGSTVTVAERSLNIAFTITGKFVGEMSTRSAPARNVFPDSAAGRFTAHTVANVSVAKQAIRKLFGCFMSQYFES